MRVARTYTQTLHSLQTVVNHDGGLMLNQGFKSSKSIPLRCVS